jgi:peptidoglycan/LPS O-acetylase OafA/YrhL
MRARRGFRTDVDGLRAVAILAVVLYHAHVPGFDGGFVGVDIFFVVSGFLITGLLWRELEEHGRISLSNFYARRVRRLLPASMLVLVVTVVASSRWLPPLEARSVAKDAMASALYIPNYRFALQSTNYLAGTTVPSPLQHYWSLGVEEQFYLLWPALVVLASMAWRRAPGERRPSGRQAWLGLHSPPRGRVTQSRVAAMAIFLAVGIGSFVLSAWLTRVSQPWAFFSLPTRAWELIGGGLVALAMPWLRRLSKGTSVFVGWAGMAVMVWAVAQFSGSTVFPGMAALVPVGGTIAVLVAGSTEAAAAGPTVLLRRIGFQLIGKISYSWYLWHWPVLVLAPFVIGHPLARWEGLLLVLLSGLLALATLAAVELPVRLSPWLVERGRVSLALGGALSGAAVVATLLVVGSLPALQGHGIAPAAVVPAGALGRPVALGRELSSGGGRTEVPDADPRAAALVSANAPIVSAVAQSVGIEDVPANLAPPLGRAGADKAAPFVDGCADTWTDTTVRTCAFGLTQSTRRVVLFGDSHAMMWFPALNALATARGFRLEALGKTTCPPFQLAIWSPELGRRYTECDTWRSNVLARIRVERPALVVLGVARHYDTALFHFQVYGQEWLTALATTVAEIRQTGAEVIVMGPVPKPGNVPDCLSAHLTNAAACTVSPQAAINSPGLDAERDAVAGARGTYVDTRPWFCSTTTCAVIVDNLLVFRDDNHVTTRYAAFVAPAVGAEMDLATKGAL